jgi:hypothetical protein
MDPQQQRRKTDLVSRLPYLYANVPNGGHFTDLRVRPATEQPTEPAIYQTNAGIVRLDERGSHAAVVELLKAAPRN